MAETIEARILVEVQWGLIPGTVDGNRQWGYSREQVDAAKSWDELLKPAYDEFDARMNPSAHNWVTLTWLWL